MARRLTMTIAILLLGGAVWLGVSRQAASTTKRSRALAGAEANSPVHAELIAEHASIQPGGTTRIGVYFALEEGWHIYSKEPGDAGLPTEITWSGPPGVTFGLLEWPTPEQFVDPGDITTFGYRGNVLLASRLGYAVDTLPSGAIPIHAEVQWLACKAICIPGSTELDLTLPVRAGPHVPTEHAALFDGLEP